MILDKYLLPHASSKPSIQFFLTQTISPLPVPTECLGWIAQLGKLNLNLLKNKGRRVSSINLWASLVAQLVKNPPAMQETLVQFLGWENPREKG